MEDLISRQAAIDAVADLYWMDERLLNFKKEIDATFDKIKALPSAQPEPRPKRGKWETKPFRDPNDPMKDTGAVWCRCSECKTKLGVFKDGNFFDYCPNCGAKMEGG